MYRDTRGRTGFRGLLGESGKRYGNVKLLSPDELEAMLLDGITEVSVPAVKPPSAAAMERQRRQQIRGAATTRIKEHLLGTEEDGNDALLDVLIDIIEVQVDLFRDLKSKGLMTDSDFNSRVIEMKDRLVLYRDVKRAARDAITNEDELAAAQAAIDAIISP